MPLGGGVLSPARFYTYPGASAATTSTSARS